MNAEERKLVQHRVQVSLRRRAAREVDTALTNGALVHDIASELNLPADVELRNLVAAAGNPIRVELHNAARRQSVRNFWDARSHRAIVMAPILAILLLVGAGLRLDRISRQSQWLDEYWALYLATGRGNLIFDLPYNQLIESPPECGFERAPPIWHIWNGISSVTHPPLYYLMLRAWIDAFGESDLSTRMLSTVFSLGAIVLLFDIVRRSTLSTGQAAVAAAMMALAPAQIDFSQTARPYSMIEFLALLSADLLILIQLKGPSKIRIAAMLAAFVATALTHYFTAGFFIAVGLFSLIRLRGRTRTAVLITLLAAFLIVVAAWGPMFWRAHNLIALDNYVRGSGIGTFYSFFNLPRRLLLHLSFETGFLAMWAMAIVVYVSPLFRLKREPQLLFWWLWALCVPGFLLAWDSVRGTHFISVTRYTLLASPALFAILATPLPTRLGKFVPVVFMIAACASAFARWEEGPPPTPDIRAGAKLIASDVPAGDAVIIPGDATFPEPSFYYFAISHYIGPWKHPVVLLQSPASESARSALQKYSRAWIWTNNPAGVQNLLEGWTIKSEPQSAGFHLLKVDVPAPLPNPLKSR